MKRNRIIALMSACALAISLYTPAVHSSASHTGVQTSSATGVQASAEENVVRHTKTGIAKIIGGIAVEVASVAGLVYFFKNQSTLGEKKFIIGGFSGAGISTGIRLIVSGVQDIKGKPVDPASSKKK